MDSAELPRSIERLQIGQPALWLLAVVFFGVGDVVTTSIGLEMASVHEAGPLTSLFLAQYGYAAMIGVKVLVLCGFYFLWRFAPRGYRVGVPLGLAGLGVFVVWWNLLVNLLAVGF
jgi:hypothetical protein